MASSSYPNLSLALTCGESLYIAGRKEADCMLWKDHYGLHVATYEHEQITGQRTIDDGRLWEKIRYTVSWNVDRASSKDVGKDSPEWRRALAVDRG